MWWPPLPWPLHLRAGQTTTGDGDLVLCHRGPTLHRSTPAKATVVTDVSTPPMSGSSPTGSPSAADTVQGPPGRRAVKITAIIALIGVVVSILALVYASLPLRTPTQDCGTAASFLIDGRVNEFPDPNDLPTGVTIDDVDGNARNPCQERAGNRALPAGIVFLLGLVIALGAAAVEFFVRLRLARRARTRALALAAAPPPPPPPPMDPPPPLPLG